MKILLTGGGTGGHFYPLIAVAEEIISLSKEQKILTPELFYAATTPYNPSLLSQNNITYIQIPSGKIRRYTSIQNVLDVFKTLKGMFVALFKVFSIYPDVVFGKGGYSSFPTLFAARILRIPVIIHESDSVPGRVNVWAGGFANRIALSYPEASSFFKKAELEKRIAWTGNPIRNEIAYPNSDGAEEAFGFNEHIPVILVLGGSQGAFIINEAIVDGLDKLISKYYVVHQTGEKNFHDIKTRSDVVLEKNPNKDRYKPFAYLNEDQMRMITAKANIILSRAGSTIFEIAAWGIPSILIPITERLSTHQTYNAFNYAKTGAAFVIEEHNLKPEIINAEVDKILSNPELQVKMKTAAHAFARLDAARTIAEAILDIGLSHEK